MGDHRKWSSVGSEIVLWGTWVKDDPRIGMELRALLPRTYNLKAIADPVGSPCAELMVDKHKVCVFFRSTPIVPMTTRMW